MKDKLVEEWTNALRSGKYEKGRGNLKSENEETGNATYCCLGVLCDITNAIDFEDSKVVINEELYEHMSQQIYDVNSSAIHYAGERDYYFEDEELPPSAASWFGLKESAQRDLINMNDAKIEVGAEMHDDAIHVLYEDTYTFNNIAEKIEELYIKGEL